MSGDDLVPGVDLSPAFACGDGVALRRLRFRPQFLLLNPARRAAAPAFVLQGRDRADGDAGIGVGFTCSKKVGNSVARNRAKRRLREAARLVVPTQGRPGWDYALIGRRDTTADRPFDALLTDLGKALARIHP